MARRKRNRTGQFTGGGSTPRGATNIVIRNDDRNGTGMARRSRGRRGGRRRGGGGGGHGTTRDIAEPFIAGMGFGLLDKLAADWGLPTIPFLGRKGTVAVGAYLLRRQHPMLANVARAGFTIGGFQLMTDGKISGDDDDGASGVL